MNNYPSTNPNPEKARNQAITGENPTGTLDTGEIPAPFRKGGEVSRSPCQKNTGEIPNKLGRSPIKMIRKIEDSSDVKEISEGKSSKDENDEISSESENDVNYNRSNSKRKAKDIISPSPKTNKVHRRKRFRTHKQTETEENQTNFEKHYILLPENSAELSKMSPFALQREITNKIGAPEAVRLNRNGTIKIKVKDQKQAEEIKKITTISDLAIKTESDKKLNTSRGVITCWALKNCTEEELKQELKLQNVCDVKKIYKRSKDTSSLTDSVILTFNTTSPPSKIQVSMFFNLQVRPYIPSPLRCYNCQKFGHISNWCKSAPMCSCGKSVHEGSPCNEPPMCLNCGGLHNARSVDCPILAKEREIQRIKVINSMEYRDARALVNSQSYAMPLITYANKTKPRQPTQKNDQNSHHNLPLRQETVNKDKTETSETIKTTETVQTEERETQHEVMEITQIQEQEKPKENQQENVLKPWIDTYKHNKDNSETNTEEEIIEKKQKTKTKKKGWPLGKPRKLSCSSITEGEIIIDNDRGKEQKKGKRQETSTEKEKQIEIQQNENKSET